MINPSEAMKGAPMSGIGGSNHAKGVEEHETSVQGANCSGNTGCYLWSKLETLAAPIVLIQNELGAQVPRYS